MSDINTQEGRSKYFQSKTTKELEYNLNLLLKQDKIGGMDSIDILGELLVRKDAGTGIIGRLVEILHVALNHFRTMERYGHYHCHEEIIAIFKGRIEHESKPSESDIMCFVTCIDAFYSAGLRYESDKSGIEQLTKFIMANWTKGVNIFHQIQDEDINPRHVEKFIIALDKKRRPYSFITKFYHQFRSDYPIYDSKLEKLLCVIFPEVNKSVYKEYTKYYNIIYYVLLKTLNNNGLNMSVNDFDNAAWILVKEKEEEIKANGNKFSLNELLN